MIASRQVVQRDRQAAMDKTHKEPPSALQAALRSAIAKQLAERTGKSRTGAQAQRLEQQDQPPNPPQQRKPRSEYVRRAVEESQLYQRRGSPASYKGKERAFDEDDDHSAVMEMVQRAISAANMLPQQSSESASPAATAASTSAHAATAREGQKVVGGSSGSSGTLASQSQESSSAAKKKSSSVVASTSMPASSAKATSVSASSAETSVPSASRAARTTSTVAAASSTKASASSAQTSSVSSLKAAIASTSSAAMTSSSQPAAASTSAAAAAAAHHGSLSQNTPLMVVLIVGSIIGASVVLFGLTWLCRRSRLRPNRGSRGRFYTGPWSPGADSTAKYITGTPDTAILFAGGKPVTHGLAPSPMPELKPDRLDVEAAGAGQYSGYGYGSNFDLNLRAPHQLKTPRVAAATPFGMTFTGGTPNANGRGWSLYDRPLGDLHEGSSDKAESVRKMSFDEGEGKPSPFAAERDVLAAPTSAVKPPRRPTFIQRLLDQPSRASNGDLTSRLSKSEKTTSASESGGSRRTRFRQKAGSGGGAGALFSAIRSANNSITRDVYLPWAVKASKRKNITSVPEDSDFEGTIGAPDNEVPKAKRVKKGERFACDVTTASEGEDDSASEQPSPMVGYQPQLPGMTWCGGGTPRTPGLAGVGASFARSDARRSKIPGLERPYAPPVAVNSLQVPGRQLVGSPRTRGLGNGPRTPGTLAHLKQQQALLEEAERRQVPAHSDLTGRKISERVTSWWDGSWNAEWPSPTSTAARQGVARRCEESVSPKTAPHTAEIPDDVSTLVSRTPSSVTSLSCTSAQNATASSGSCREAVILKAQERRALAHAQAELLRMGSLRPKFAASTTLESWLNKPSEQPKLETAVEDDLQDEGSDFYECSLQSPTLSSASSAPDYIEDDEFAILRKASEATLTADVSAGNNELSPTICDYADAGTPLSPSLVGPPMPSAAHQGRDSLPAETVRHTHSLPPPVRELRQLVLVQASQRNSVPEGTQWDQSGPSYVASRRDVERRARESRRAQRAIARRQEEKMMRHILSSSSSESLHAQYVQSGRTAQTADVVGVSPMEEVRKVRMAKQPSRTSLALVRKDSISASCVYSETTSPSEYERDGAPSQATPLSTQVLVYQEQDEPQSAEVHQAEVDEVRDQAETVTSPNELSVSQVDATVTSNHGSPESEGVVKQVLTKVPAPQVGAFARPGARRLPSALLAGDKQAALRLTSCPVQTMDAGTHARMISATSRPQKRMSSVGSASELLRLRVVDGKDFGYHANFEVCLENSNVYASGTEAAVSAMSPLSSSDSDISFRRWGSSRHGRGGWGSRPSLTATESDLSTSTRSSFTGPSTASYHPAYRKPSASASKGHALTNEALAMATALAEAKDRASAGRRKKSEQPAAAALKRGKGASGSVAARVAAYQAQTQKSQEMEAASSGPGRRRERQRGVRVPSSGAAARFDY